MDTFIKYSVIFLMVSAISCNQTKTSKLLEYSNGRQLLNLNDKTLEGKPLQKPTVHINVSDTIPISETIKARIFLEKGPYKLLAAFYDCKPVKNPTVDATSKPINYTKWVDGCSKELFIENDTIKMDWKSPSTGYKTFKDITLLLKYDDGVFRTQVVNFDYYVSE